MLNNQNFDSIKLLIEKDLAKGKVQFQQKDWETAIDKYKTAYNRTSKTSFPKKLWDLLDKN